jgi:hypothetical protein
MPSIFQESEYAQIVDRIKQLSSASQRKWGKMNVAQMLEHCSIQLKKALGILPVGKPAGPAIYRTTIGRWLALHVVPWPKGSATPPEMNMDTNGVVVQDVEKGKQQLLHLLQQVQERESFGPHTFFGAMNKKDWGRLIWKHLDHHLRQFGA